MQMKEFFLLCWIIYVTVMSIIMMFDNFFGAVFSWFILAFILPQIFGAFDE